MMLLAGRFCVLFDEISIISGVLIYFLQLSKFPAIGLLPAPPKI
jgi:hypothetical protein